MFPKLDDSKTISDYRTRYDDLVEHIRPHVQLVFPFESEMSDQRIGNAVAKVIERVRQMKAVLGDAYTIPSARTVEVEVLLVKQEIIDLHDALYKEPEFAKFLNKQIPYRPHVTIARNVTDSEAKQIVKKYNAEGNRQEMIIDSVSIERILENGDSDEFFNHELGS